MANIHNFPGEEMPGATKLSATDKSGESDGDSPLSKEALELAEALDAGLDTPGGKQAEWSTFTSKTTREGAEKH
jgi:hypothetical protein